VGETAGRRPRRSGPWAASPSDSSESALRPSAAGRALDRAAARILRLPPATTTYRVARDLRIPVRDGVELAADLYRAEPEAAGTLLLRGPYGRSLPQALPFARVFAERGYHVLYVSVRGTFGSGGRFEPMVSEVEDGHDVVAWMRDQPWFTGTFGTLGGSYLGFTQWALLVDPPPEMTAAVISVAPHDFSRHAWGTGSFRLDFLGWSHMVVHQEDGGALRGAVRMARAQRRDAAAMDELPLTLAASTYLGGRGPWYTDWVSRSDLDDPFWAPMNLTRALDRVDVPVLLISGWYDLFLDQTLEQYAHLRHRGIDVAMTVGPWSHIAVGAGAARITANETFDWFEEHVARRGLRRRTAPVRVFVTGADEWRDLRAWPPPTGTRTWYLGPHADLLDDPPPEDAPASSFLFDPSHPTPTVGGPLLSTKAQVDDSSLAARADLLTLSSEPLQTDVEVIGEPVVELSHSSDNPHADLFVRLSDVGADGGSRNITEGFVRLDPRRPAGTVSLRLRATAHRFVAGHRIRLVVAGGSHPQFARNLGTDEDPALGVTMRPARHTVRHGEGGRSTLVMPVT
jgi:putative CocE/NonD family hydrolase